MACRVELTAHCGEVAGLARALYLHDRDDSAWLSRCAVSLSPCGSLLAVARGSRLCLLASQWIPSTESNAYLISWSGTLPAEAAVLLALPICSTSVSQNGPDWVCIIVGFKNGEVGFYTNTGHLLLTERLDDKPVLKVSCHTGSFGSDADDVHILFQSSVCVLSGSSLFQTLRYAKAQLARVHAGVSSELTLEGRNIVSRKWHFLEQDLINDAVVVGLELKNTYDHLLAASTFGGYDTWYRSLPPHNTLVLGAGARPYVGFHYALEGGASPPLQDVARAVASKIKSALPGWLGGGSSTASSNPENKLRSEPLSMRSGLQDIQRQASSLVLSPDKRLAAVTDNLGRVAIIDVQKGNIIRLFKGYRDSQCAFMQVFEQDNKRGPSLNNAKETRKAIFLIIYNPKKGLIDIRLMQRGSRVAVFTATKNGKLIYNTHGLVGSESNYSQKKLNLPAFPCVLLDPDGKIKKFIIPFHNALEGENSLRAKDLHLVKELKSFLKQNPDDVNFEDEILRTVKELKTPDLKRHTLELLIGTPEVRPEVVLSCLDMFLDQLSDIGKLNSQEAKLRIFSLSVKSIASFFLQINLKELPAESINSIDSKDITNMDIDNISTCDIDAQIDNNDKSMKVDLTAKTDNPKSSSMSDDTIGNNSEESGDDINDVSKYFRLTEVDTKILERLLELAKENSTKDSGTPKVTFADHKRSIFKDFVTAFDLEQVQEQLELKSILPVSRVSALASHTFKSMFAENYPKPKDLGEFVRSSHINPKVFVKLLIIYWMDTPLAEVNLVIVEKFIAILYNICQASPEATSIVYNEVSPWWQSIRDILVDMPCPLRTMIVAMVCRIVGQIVEQNPEFSNMDEAWVSVTTENAKWSLLVGKLEDISILSIVLQFKGIVKGKALPKLKLSELEINLQYIYNRGKGAVSELIAKWLCSKGLTAEAIAANEVLQSLNIGTECKENMEELKTEDDSGYMLTECDRICVEENPHVFKWLNILKKQFPYSASTNNLIANMCWEYAASWQKNLEDIGQLKAVLSCLNNLTNIHLCFGLCTLIWMTYIKGVFESSCRLVNKVGKLPKERLCIQDVSLSDTKMVEFLQLCTKFLERFLYCATKMNEFQKPTLQFEKIWDESTPALIEVAQETDKVNHGVLTLNYQIACVIYYQCNFNIKMAKPLNMLFDCDLQYVFGGLTSTEEVNNDMLRTAEGKLRVQRMKFLGKVVGSSLELISCEDSAGDLTYRSAESCAWMEKVYTLAELWNIDNDFIRREQIVGLYKLGYDTLAEDVISSVRDTASLVQPLVATCAQRLKRCLENSSDVSNVLAALPPELAMHLQTLESDTAISANISLKSTASVLENVICRVQNGDVAPAQHKLMKLAELMIYGCDILQEFSQ